VTDNNMNWDWEAAWDKTEPPTNTHPIQLKPENIDNAAGNWITAQTLMQAAIDYATNGRPVFPCQPWDGAYNKADAKAPLTRNGFKDATTVIEQIRAWWQRYPFAMIGSPVPKPELCLDIDPRSDGDRWDLIELAGITELPVTRMVLSGRYDGGHHLFYQRPHGALTDVRLPKGIDLRVGGKHYTILPPSVHDASGGSYLWRWQWDAPAAPLPDEVAALLVPVEPKVAVSATSYKPSSKALAGILNKVATMPEGGDGFCKGRQTIGRWAANILRENNYPLAAWDAVEDAMRISGATSHDIRTALRDRPDRKFGRVHA
jgi:hypothetical protein